MMIVNRISFLNLPKGTVYSEYSKGGNFTDLCVKVSDKSDYSNDWRYIQLNGFDAWDDSIQLMERLKEMEESEVAYYNNYDSSHRDGIFEEDQLFAIYAISDIEKMIKLLQQAIDQK